MPRLLRFELVYDVLASLGKARFHAQNDGRSWTGLTWSRTLGRHRSRINGSRMTRRVWNEVEQPLRSKKKFKDRALSALVDAAFGHCFTRFHYVNSAEVSEQ